MSEPGRFLPHAKRRLERGMRRNAIAEREVPIAQQFRLPAS